MSERKIELFSAEVGKCAEGESRSEQKIQDCGDGGNGGWQDGLLRVLLQPRNNPGEGHSAHYGQVTELRPNPQVKFLTCVGKRFYAFSASPDG